jgi:cellulose synthase/poly-beta-1,6-N-acetylglucosamine synthase-like glycosyltransferase
MKRRMLRQCHSVRHVRKRRSVTAWWWCTTTACQAVASHAMLEGKRVAVVVPAHDEEKLIGQTVRGIPEFVDRIYVVDDRSKDATVELARALPDPRVQVIEHERNQGVGAAIITGYKAALEERDDVTAVMARLDEMPQVLGVHLVVGSFDPEHDVPGANASTRRRQPFGCSERLTEPSCTESRGVLRYLEEVDEASRGRGRPVS